MEGPPGTASTFALSEVKTTAELTSVLLLSFHLSLSLFRSVVTSVPEALSGRQLFCNNRRVQTAFKSGNAHISDAAGSRAAEP